MFDDQQTCHNVVSFLPSSAAECNKKILAGSDLTGAKMIEYIYPRCCKQGSKPNGLCGMKLQTATPCKSKAAGEFMPAAM